MELHNFKQTVLPLKDKLYRFALRITNHESEAEDIAQEVVVKLWNKRASLENYKSTEALAMVIAKNMSLDYLKSKRSKAASLNDFPGLPDRKGTPYELLEQRDAVSHLKSGLQKLPEQQRIIVHLRDIEQLELDQIAEITKLSMNAVRVNLSRARKSLKEYLLKLAYDEHAKT
ncbi:MAG: sigma-70 family RNA polymerase sigma factor [Bacteroidales bacterium]|nr:sigma-70 family RNA polymerase sigma factor [Bacteroidales bacterium]